MFDKNYDFTGKDIIIVDDIVSTGRTILQTAEIAQEFKAKTISFAFIHSIFGDKAAEELSGINPKKIVFTNTLENSEATIDITKELTTCILKNKLI